MRLAKSSTTAHIKAAKSTNRALDNKLAPVFYQLKKLLSEYEPTLKVVKNTEHHYELWTTYRLRTQRGYPRAKSGLQFGAVIRCQACVGFYLHPLYLERNIKEQFSEDLKKVITGKSTLHFKSLSIEEVKEVELTLRRCLDFYKTINLI